MKSKYLSHAAFALSIAAAAAGASCSGTEHTETVTAEITAAQMEGRNAARLFVNREWKDTSNLRENLFDADSIKNKYMTDGKPECAAAFDSAFISTIRAVRPELAETVRRNRK